MKHLKAAILLCTFSLCFLQSFAQKTFTEGTITYKVTMTGPDNTSYKGVYVFSFKDEDLRKELTLDNGYVDILLINSAKSTVYTLQSWDGQKYAIQLSMEDLLAKQRKLKGYTLTVEENAGKMMAGCTAISGKVTYKDGKQTDITFTKEWQPSMPLAYNRFPDANFLPLRFSIGEDNGMVMVFEASSLEPNPVPSSIFRIPKDYKMISYDEYKALNK